MTFSETMLITGMMLVTFAARYPVLALLSRFELPEWLLRALRYIPPAVLTALIVPALVMPDGEKLAISPANATLIAGSAAVLIAWRTRNLLLTLSIGMAVFWGWRWVLALGDF
jgi:branched-subunit amino acid transport protein